MSVLIKGMEMPEYPTAIRIQIEADGSVYQNSDKTGNGWALQKNVTATEVPTHGRLIDADAMNEKYGDWYTEEGTEEGFIGTLKYLIAEQPIIIEEEGEK